jgi:periplasmic copper chaperone A
MIMQQERGPRRMPGGLAGVRNAPAATKAAGFAGVLLLGASALAGCAQQAAAAASLELGTAYVAVPNTGDVTSAYLVIRNNGPADRLVSARTSDGGRVTFRSPSRAGDRVMESVPDIGIPADSLLRLSPDGSHLLITGAGPMKGGTQITLTLTFARGGTMSVAAAVTNPESGGSSYFLN